MLSNHEQQRLFELQEWLVTSSGAVSPTVYEDIARLESKRGK